MAINLCPASCCECNFIFLSSKFGQQLLRVIRLTFSAPLCWRARDEYKSNLSISLLKSRDSKKQASAICILNLNFCSALIHSLARSAVCSFRSFALFQWHSISLRSRPRWAAWCRRGCSCTSLLTCLLAWCLLEPFGETLADNAACNDRPRSKGILCFHLEFARLFFLRAYSLHLYLA